MMSCPFSFLAPGKHIPEHRGPLRAILRFHLMLSTPCDKDGIPACIMNIDGLPYRLGDGESLLWDDTGVEPKQPGAHRAAARRVAQAHAR